MSLIIPMVRRAIPTLLKEPTADWVNTVRPAGIAKYGEEWLDWEVLIEYMVVGGNRYHPSRTTGNQFVCDRNKPYDMKEIDWTIMGTDTWKQYMSEHVIPESLIKYQVLML